MWLISSFRPFFDIFLIFLLAVTVSADYRHFHLDNADICNSESSKPLDIGSGAVILQLDSPSRSFQPSYKKSKQCEVRIKAPGDPPHGLLAYVEQMNLRRSSHDGRCVDYVQFGQHDRIPLITLKKSDQFCGARDGRRYVANGISYDDPYGNLLVWVSVGGRRSTQSWQDISVVNLTLVITAYLKDCERSPKSAGFRRCGDRKSCIYGNYFCDGHFNCLNDKIPLDEDGCVYENEKVEGSTTQGPGGERGGDAGIGADLNSITKTVVILCVTLVVLLLLILWVRHHRNKEDAVASMARATSTAVGGGVQPQPLSLDELNNQRHLQETDPNVYLPLTTRPQPPRHPQPPTDEPPPAYADLFPEAAVAAGASETT